MDKKLKIYIATNSSRNRKIDIPAIRHSFSKMIRIVPNSDEESKFSEKQILVVA